MFLLTENTQEGTVQLCRLSGFKTLATYIYQYISNGIQLEDQRNQEPSLGSVFLVNTAHIENLLLNLELEPLRV